MADSRKQFREQPYRAAPAHAKNRTGNADRQISALIVLFSVLAVLAAAAVIAVILLGTADRPANPSAQEESALPVSSREESEPAREESGENPDPSSGSAEESSASPQEESSESSESSADSEPPQSEPEPSASPAPQDPDPAETGTELFGTDFVRAYVSPENMVINGISYVWSDSQCTVSGTAWGNTDYFLFRSQTSLPEGMNPGDSFLIRFKATDPSIRVQSIFWNAEGDEIANVYDDRDIPLKVPDDAAGWALCIYVRYGRMAYGTVTRIEAVKLREKAMEVPLIVSFVDDDTTSEEYVERFYNACRHNGIPGTFAVITQHLGEKDVSTRNLLRYEEEGFGTVIHCYQQTGAAYWAVTDRTQEETDACRENLEKGLLMMEKYGFSDYRYWVTPGGHHEDDLVQIARDLELPCLISTQDGRFNALQDMDPWYIKRVSLHHDDSSDIQSMEAVREYIDSCVEAGGGWLIITTHFNQGWENLSGTDGWNDTLDANGYPTGYARFNEAVQYALEKGMTPMTIPQAWQYYGPILEANISEYENADN